MKNKTTKKLTNGHKEVPLFYVTFDLNKYLETGEKGSCNIRLHPSVKEDETIVEILKDLIEHIRKNYDMESLVK
ncbi:MULTISPECIES: hypothetical protein [unclassified Psychrobacillus]|uniref:hypothetical protein n=1 Tax=unclassified Psychrobacillus TaxID=2636677 RepID=UPI0030F91D73